MPPTTDEAVTTEGGGYVEDPNFVPNPTDAYGTIDTSGTGGGAHSRIEEITPIFDVAKAQDLATAAKALDPDDPSVHSSLVTLPEGQRITPVDPEASAEKVKKAAEAASGPIDVSTSRMTDSKAAAAEEGGEPETKDQPDPTGGTGASSTTAPEGSTEPEKDGEKGSRSRGQKD